MKKGNSIFSLSIAFMAIAAFGSGCTVGAPTEFGDVCPPKGSGAEMMGVTFAYIKASDSQVCRFGEPCSMDDGQYGQNFKAHACPVDVPVCALHGNIEGNPSYYCMAERCSDDGNSSLTHKIACNGECIDPMNDDYYCGAKPGCYGFETCDQAQGMSCKDGRCVKAGCKDDAMRCSSDKSSIEVCQNKVWKKAEADNCTVDEKCVQTGASVSCEERNCREGESKCDQNDLLRCENDQWVTVLNCPEEAVCDSDMKKCVPRTCVEGESICTDGMELKCVYGDDGWTWSDVRTPCLANNSCTVDRVCGECANGLTRCVTNEDGETGRLQTCRNGYWEDSFDCLRTGAGDSSPTSCTANVKGSTCGVCKNGEVTCSLYEGRAYTVKCVDGFFDIEGGVDCSDNDEAVSCKGTGCGVCLDGNIKCQNEEIVGEDGSKTVVGKLQTCVDGDWSSASSCPNDVSCNSEGTNCGECATGTTKCSYDDSTNQAYVARCENGAWVRNHECSGFSCNADQTACGVCLNDDMRCEANEAGAEFAAHFDVCSEGAWVTSGCGACKDDKTCGTCVEGQTSCVTDASGVGQLSTCSSLSIETEPCDDGYSCHDNKCGTCKNGTEKCENDSETGIGKYSTCRNGAFVETSCRSTSCQTNGTCGLCKNGETRCNVKDTISLLETCVDGRWTSQMCLGTNGVPLSCTADGKACGSCKSGTEVCEMREGGKGFKRTCVNGAWTEEVACADNASCVDGKYYGACHTGDKVCLGGMLRSCENGVWNVKECSNGADCLPDRSDCGECAEGTRSCREQKTGMFSSSYYLKQCVGGKWTSEEKCLANSTCNADMTDCAVCEEGKISRCVNNSDHGVLTICRGGVWVKEYCESGYSCNSTNTGCGKCINGLERSCESAKKEYCKAGAWTKGACESNFSCKSPYACGECQTGDHRCARDENSGKWTESVCISGLWTYMRDCNVDSSADSKTACKSYSNSILLWEDAGSQCKK